MYISHFAKLKKVLQSHLYSYHPHDHPQLFLKLLGYSSFFLSVSSDDQFEVSLVPFSALNSWLCTLCYWIYFSPCLASHLFFLLQVPYEEAIDIIQFIYLSVISSSLKGSPPNEERLLMEQKSDEHWLNSY